MWTINGFDQTRTVLHMYNNFRYAHVKLQNTENGTDRRKRTCDKCVQAPHIKGALVGEGWGQSMYDH